MLSRKKKVWLEENKKLHIKFTDAKDKRFIEKWESGDVDVLMAHPASAGHGLNLQKRWKNLRLEFDNL